MEVLFFPNWHALQGTSDPYVQLSLGDVSARTRTLWTYVHVVMCLFASCLPLDVCPADSPVCDIVRATVTVAQCHHGSAV